MALIEWTNQYSVGIRKIDEQHQQLIGLLNRLHDAMRNGQGGKVMREILDALVSYTKMHFRTEEELFLDHGYPSAATHKEEHDRLADKVVIVQSDLHAGSQVLAVDMLQFLRCWVSTHIHTVDMQYSTFLISKGVH